jgi:hypothetical protein
MSSNKDEVEKRNLFDLNFIYLKLLLGIKDWLKCSRRCLVFLYCLTL